MEGMILGHDLLSFIFVRAEICWVLRELTFQDLKRILYVGE